MILDANRREALAAIIAQHVPLPLLEEIVQADGAIKDFDVVIQAAAPDPDERRRAIALNVVEAYAARNQASRLARRLLKEMLGNDYLVQRIVPFLPLREDDAAKEAKLALRANTFLSRRLREFLVDAESRVCAIVSTERVFGGYGFRLGTGFLVGPDLLLTAYHNVKAHIDKDGKVAAESHKNLWAYFDFFDGDKIEYPKRPQKPARGIAFSKDWLVHASVDLPSDGRLDEKSESDDADIIAQCLDFALIRLAEPAGQQARRATGGIRRGWVDLSGWQDDLKQDERIVIPQHPNGAPQSIDFGRYSEEFSKSDKSKTRLRYDTESEPGTSGAPCFTVFDSEFHAVGMHNATFRPNGKAEANQAIDIRKIRKRISNLLGAPVPLPAAPMWNTSPDSDLPRVVLRRNTLFAWIERAARETSSGRADRLYAAVGDGHNYGKTFSIEILRAARRGHADPIVVLGTPRDAVPATVPDFIYALADQLNIPRSALTGLPPRPAHNLPNGSQDGDKLDKWASVEVPEWFERVLGKHRNSDVDRREEARRARDHLIAANYPVPIELSRIADSPVELKDMRRWTLCWIAIDGLSDSELTPEVYNLVGGLCGGKLSEPSVPQELRRLRWLFLGKAPQFADDTQIAREDLDPVAVGLDDMMACLRHFASSIQCNVPPDVEDLLREIVGMWVDEKKPSIDDPVQRLTMLQGFFQRLVKRLAQAGRVP